MRGSTRRRRAWCPRVNVERAQQPLGRVCRALDIEGGYTIVSGTGGGRTKKEVPTVGQRLSQTIREFAGLVRKAIMDHCPPDLVAEVEDIEQEARVRLWRALEDKDSERSPAYVYRLAVNATLDAVRRARAKCRSGTKTELDESRLPGGGTPEGHATREQILTWVEEFLDGQSRFVARIIPLHLQGLTTHEIADLLGCTEARARNQVYRSLHRLRHHLRRRGVEYEPRS